MRKARKLFALLLTLAMVLTYMPLTAFADFPDSSEEHHAVGLEFSGGPLHYDREAANDEEALNSVWESVYRKDNEFTITYSDGIIEKWVYKSCKIKEYGETNTHYDFFPEGEDPEIEVDEDGNEYPSNTLPLDGEIDTASETVTLKVYAGYVKEVDGGQEWVENLVTVDVKATPYPVPIKIEYSEPELKYEFDSEDKWVDVYQDGTEFIITYDDDSTERWVCHSYTYKYEGKKQTAHEFFLNGEAAKLELDEDGNEFASNCLYFETEGTDAEVCVTYTHYIGNHEYTLQTTIPKVMDVDSKYRAFIYVAKEWYDHAMFAGETEYAFPIPCKSFARDFETEFTKEDLDKVTITVTTADGKTYNPTVSKDPEIAGDYYYNYKIPAQKWGAKFTINYDYNNGAIKDELKCTVKKWLDLKYSVSDLTYNGKNRTPSVTVKNGSTVLTKGKDYIVSYEEPDAKFKNVGIYAIYINSPEDSKYAIYEAKSFKIIPKGTTISKLTKGKKSFTATWKKQATQTTGYQIQYSLKKNFKSAKTVTVSKNKTTKTTIKKLKAKKTYYVRIRTYKTVGKQKIYSSWSKSKTVKTK